MSFKGPSLASSWSRPCVVWPGQACSYMIGQLSIVELRDRARSALGSRFSVKAFHDLVLGLGNVPLDVLASEVDA